MKLLQASVLLLRLAKEYLVCRQAVKERAKADIMQICSKCLCVLFEECLEPDEIGINIFSSILQKNIVTLIVLAIQNNNKKDIPIE